MILIIGAQFRFGFAEIEYTDVVDQTVVTPSFDCIQIDFACNRIDGYGIVNTVVTMFAASTIRSVWFLLKM